MALVTFERVTKLYILVSDSIYSISAIYRSTKCERWARMGEINGGGQMREKGGEGEGSKYR